MPDLDTGRELGPVAVEQVWDAHTAQVIPLGSAAGPEAFNALLS